MTAASVRTRVVPWKEAVVAGTGRIRFLEAGTGRPVLLLHSISGSARGWRAWMEILDDAGFRAIAPELPGFGRPPVEPVFRSDHYVSLLRDFMDAVDAATTWSVIGDSLGGLLALELCPQSRMGCCVLLETPAVFPHPWLRPLTRAVVHLARRPSLQSLGTRLLGSALGRRALAAFDLTYRDDATVALEEVSALTTAPLLFLASVMDTIAAADMRECAGQVAQPVLMIVGSRDRWAPPTGGARFVPLLRRGRLHVKEGFRHGDPFHRARDVAELVIEHLRRCDGDL